MKNNNKQKQQGFALGWDVLSYIVIAIIFITVGTTLYYNSKQTGANFQIKNFVVTNMLSAIENCASINSNLNNCDKAELVSSGVNSDPGFISSWNISSTATNTVTINYTLDDDTTDNAGNGLKTYISNTLNGASSTYNTSTNVLQVVYKR